MEFETFAQCLNYLSLAQEKKQPLELITPAISSLAGVLVGASLTMLREGKKKARQSKTKKCALPRN